MVRELGERPRQSSGVVIEDGRQQVEVEGAADDRAGLGDPPGPGRPLRQAGEDRVLDGAGRVGGLGSPSTVDRSLAEDGEELLDVERDPVRPGVDRGGDVARRPGGPAR